MQNVTRETVVARTPGNVSAVSQVETLDTPLQTAVNLVYFILGLFELTLLLRLLLRVAGANPGSAFVSALYAFTGVLLLPFNSIFRPAVTTGAEVRSIFEPSILVAMLVYAALAWGVVKLIGILAGKSTEV